MHIGEAWRAVPGVRNPCLALRGQTCHRPCLRGQAQLLGEAPAAVCAHHMDDTSILRAWLPSTPVAKLFLEAFAGIPVVCHSNALLGSKLFVFMSGS